MIKQLALILTLLAAAFGAGWWVNGLHHDSVQLAVERAATAAGDKARTESQAISRESSRKLEKQLESIANAAPKEIRTEIIKPVFTNVCVSPEFVSMYNDKAAAIERALSGKFINKMPGDAAENERPDGKRR
ncbi:TPA: hypothetical protein LSH76_001308 [Morganella morganii]|nr:hypothetical protein [Morganella morganii]EKW8498762.1 hypothetical protein [Morganella morganii]MBT0345460.1 hypothetical protein [Morganella morganii subsp. morganii]MBV7311189.1 hypothetical protein [Morganella morganii]PCP72148.1 hypothetical protein CQA25_14580 [Morganella morganii]HBL6942179.1 hypothetical protein [Morganella morganii]